MKAFLQFLKWVFSLSLKEDGFEINWSTTYPKHRLIGFDYFWYDGPHHSFGFYWFQISISPTGAPWNSNCNLREALKEVVQTNPEVHLLSSNDLIRTAAEQYLKSKQQ